MRINLKLPLAMCLIVFAACQENSSYEPTKLEKRANEVLASSKFQNLGIPLASLGAPTFLTSSENSIGFFLKDSENKRAVVAQFDEESVLSYVVYYEINSAISASDAEAAMKNGSWSGSIVLKNESGSVEAAFKNSKVITSRNESKNGRTFTCAGMTETGGALWCFGVRLENMNGWDAAVCYIDFYVCYVVGVLSCMNDSCVPFPGPLTPPPL